MKEKSNLSTLNLYLENRDREKSKLLKVKVFNIQNNVYCIF